MSRAWIVLLLALLLPGAPQQAQESDLPAVADRQVDYATDIHPILATRCGQCHGSDKQKSGLRLVDRDAVLAGGDSGPAVVVGDSERSLLIQLVSGVDPERVMPGRGPRLSREEIGLLRAWIDQGLEWSTARRGSGSRELRPPRRPELPGSGPSHPIDRWLAPYLESNGVSRAARIDDRAFARRAHLDVIGLLPSRHELREFLADPEPGRRGRLVEKLLADEVRYAEHWLTFWNDVLRNDYAGTGYIDGGRKQITRWLFSALRENLPYDRFVRELLTGANGSEGFIKGIVWRGTVNASQVPAMQAAQNVSQVFLGVNIKCASCHDSFVDDWKLVDAYGMASVFSEKPLELHRCNAPQGEIAAPRFLWPELGDVDATAPRATRVAQLAEIVTSKGQARLARTIVNRLWARLLGHGLIEPVDEMAGDPWHRDLLDWLAADLVENGYDLKHTLELILTSVAYQLPATGKPPAGGPFVFRGPQVRHLSAEQFVDAVTGITRSSGRVPARIMSTLVSEGRGHTRFRSGVMASGAVDVDVDVAGAESLWLVVSDAGNNNHHDWADWGEPVLIDAAGRERPLTELGWRSATTGYGKIQMHLNIVGKPMRLAGEAVAHGIGTHANSVIVYDLPPGTRRFRARAGPDQQAVEEGGAKGHDMEFLVLTDVVTRASLARSDALQRVLGRPNREQVVTARATGTTTLQALELTNGMTLAGALARGSRWWLSRSLSGEELVDAIYESALCREPSMAERQAALGIVGSPPAQEGVEDFLWAVLMLPEFQLVY